MVECFDPPYFRVPGDPPWGAAGGGGEFPPTLGGWVLAGPQPLGVLRSMPPSQDFFSARCKDKTGTRKSTRFINPFRAAPTEPNIGALFIKHPTFTVFPAIHLKQESSAP